jgi:DNA-binding transcriptional LysR family regulator
MPSRHRQKLPKNATQHCAYNNAWLLKCQIGTYSGRFSRLCATEACRARPAHAWNDTAHHGPPSGRPRGLARRQVFHSLDRWLVTDRRGLAIDRIGRGMAAAAETAQRSASGEVDEEKGTVRITASDVIGGEVLPSILARFHAVHPRISVELALSNRNEDLLRGDADIAVRMVRPTQGALIAKQIGRIDVGLYCHRRYLNVHTMPQRLEDLREHLLIGYDRDQAYARLLERMGVPFSHDMLAFRSDSELAQLAALSAGFGIGVNQLGIARRDENLVPVLHSEFIFPMELWLAMHGDLRGSRRIRLMFDHLAVELTRYAKSGCPEA